MSDTRTQSRRELLLAATTASLAEAMQTTPSPNGIPTRKLGKRWTVLDFPWDTCQMPNNLMHYSFESFRHEVMPEAAKKGVGVIGMKGCGGDGRILSDNVTSVEECYRYCLSQPVSVQVVGLASLDHLNRALAVARSFKPVSADEMKTLSARVRDAAGDGRYEHFKTTQRLDAGYHHRQHGFEG
jgi:hypothetical protein